MVGSEGLEPGPKLAAVFDKTIAALARDSELDYLSGGFKNMKITAAPEMIATASGWQLTTSDFTLTLSISKKLSMKMNKLNRG